MAKPFEEHRSGRDRRHRLGSEEMKRERRTADRRQFLPPKDPASMTGEAEELQAAIDAYKIERGLMRISIPDMLELIGRLGYRRT